VDDKEVDDKDELEAISASTPAERTRPRSWPRRMLNY
jgi:hypothetical protein